MNKTPLYNWTYYFRITIIALKALVQDFWRSALSLLGIVVSIIAIMIVVTLGANVNLYIQNQIAIFGPDAIHVEVQVPTKNVRINVGDVAGRAQITTLTPKDAEALRKLPDIKTASVGVISQARIQHGNVSKHVMLLGSDHFAPQTDSGLVLASGRFISAEDVVGKANVLVLGANIAHDFFGSTVATGKRVRVNGTTYRIIGVVKKRGALFGFNYDDLAYMPYTTLTEKLMGIDHLAYITLKTGNAHTVDQSAKNVRALLQLRHKTNGPGEDDFIVTTMQEAQDLIGNIVQAISILLIALASISILVGGVGIMNMMLMSVEERKREIGLRVALGARRSDILVQFLIESIMISLVAAVIGIFISFLLLYGVGTFAVAHGFVASFTIPLSAVALSTGFSIVSGILFGVYPARTAAKIQPINAMKS